MIQLEKTDPICFERIKSTWKEWANITQSNKDKQYDSLEEYLEFRIIDVGAS
jgi:ophiobolin F synthase